MKSLSEFFSLLIYTGFEKKIKKPKKFYYIYRESSNQFRIWFWCTQCMLSNTYEYQAFMKHYMKKLQFLSYL